MCQANSHLVCIKCVLKIMINIKENISLKDYTTLKIGGSARYFVEALSEEELKEAVIYAQKNNLKYLVIAGGSNLLVNDMGYEGLIIKVNYSQVMEENEKVQATAGMQLQELVDYAIGRSHAGIEKLTGIPGSVGGAVYGNAGAFGQTISDRLTRIKVFDGEKTFWLNNIECELGYRESIFKKHKDWTILAVEFSFEQGESSNLNATAREIIKKRAEKYTPGVLCPGSFFKNLLIEKLPKEIQGDMPKDYYGKVPAWWFLEQTGAKGAKKGNIKITDYHANLFINEGNGKAQDFFNLAKEYKQKVKEKFGVELEPEVQLVGFDKHL